MSENEVAAPPEVEGEPSGQGGQSNSRVSVWVQGHTPLAIAIAGLLSAVLTLLAANPVIMNKLLDSKEVTSLQKVTAEIAESPGRRIPKNGIVEISGSFDGALQGRSLWAFVRNIDNGTLWPSHEPCSVVAAEEKYSCEVTPLPGASEFQVRLVDSRGVNEILQWVMKENAGNAPALNKVGGSEILKQSALSQ